jgi:hypothetical protein
LFKLIFLALRLLCITLVVLELPKYSNGRSSDNQDGNVPRKKRNDPSCHTAQCSLVYQRFQSAKTILPAPQNLLSIRESILERDVRGLPASTDAGDRWIGKGWRMMKTRLEL